MSMEHLTVFISPQPLPVEVQSPVARPATPSSFHFWLEQQRSSTPQRQPAPVKPPVQPLHIPVRTPVQSANPVFQPIRTQPALKPFKADADKTPDKDKSVSQSLQKQPLSQVLKVEVTGLLLIESPSTQSTLKTEPSELPPAPEESPDQTALFWASLAFEALSRQMQPLGFGQVAPQTQPQAPALGFDSQSANQGEETQTISAAEPAQTPESLGFASALPLKLQVTFNYQLLFFVALRSPRKAASTESENAGRLNSDNLGAEVTEQPTEAVQAPVAPGAFSSEPDFTDANAEDQTDSDSPTSSDPTPTPVVQAPAVETPAAPAPVVQAPAVDTPAAPAPVAQAPIVETPEAPAPVAQAPAVETPAAPAPVAQAPAVETPAAPAPVAQAPIVETPAAPTPVVQAPAVETPAAPAPVAQAPAVETPDAPAPVAQAPAVETPEAPAPVAQAPAVETPAAPAPVAQAPAVETPAAPAPVVQAPAVETPAAPAPVAQAPAVETPGAPAPVAQAPAVETPAAPTPVVQAPAVETPTAPTPVVQAPAVETPATPAPAAQAPAVETPEAPAPIAQAPAVDTPAAPAPVAQAPQASAAPIASELLLGEIRIRILLLAKQGVHFNDLPPAPTHNLAEDSAQLPPTDHPEFVPQLPVSGLPRQAEPTDSSTATVSFTLELVSAGLAASFLNFKNESESSEQPSQESKPYQMPLLSQNWSQGELSVASMETAAKPNLLALSPEKPWWLELVEAASEETPSPERLQAVLADAAEQEEESGFPWEDLVKPLLQASTAPPFAVPQRSNPTPQIRFFSAPPQAKETPISVPAVPETTEADREETDFQPENTAPLQAPLAPLPFSLPPQPMHFHKAPPRSAGLALLSWSKVEIGPAPISAPNTSQKTSQVTPEVNGNENQQVQSGLKFQVVANPVRTPQAKASPEEPNPGPVGESKAKSQQPLRQDRSAAPQSAMSAQTAIQLHNQGVPLQVSDFPAFVNQVLQTRNFKVGALQSIEVTLNPQNLGKVNAHFMLREQNEMIVRLYAPNAVAAKTLETYVQDIQQMIQKSYLVAGQVEIKQGIPPARGPQGGNTSGQNTDFSSRQAAWKKGSSRRRKKDDDMSVDVTV